MVQIEPNIKIWVNVFKHGLKCGLTWTQNGTKKKD
jgi:hypothetical protein